MLPHQSDFAPVSKGLPHRPHPLPRSCLHAPCGRIQAPLLGAFVQVPGTIRGRPARHDQISEAVLRLCVHCRRPRGQEVPQGLFPLPNASPRAQLTLRHSSRWSPRACSCSLARRWLTLHTSCVQLTLPSSPPFSRTLRYQYSLFSLPADVAAVSVHGRTPPTGMCATLRERVSLDTLLSRISL